MAAVHVPEEKIRRRRRQHNAQMDCQAGKPSEDIRVVFDGLHRVLEKVIQVVTGSCHQARDDLEANPISRAATTSSSGVVRGNKHVVQRIDTWDFATFQELQAT